MLKGFKSQRLIALFLAGWMFLNFPLLALWDGEARVFGLPLFPLGLFIIWTVLIVALALIAERRED